MFPDPDDLFESTFVPVAGETVLLLTRRSGTGSETRLYRSDDAGATFTPLTAPERIHVVLARPDRLLAVAGDMLHESRDGGARWTSTPLPGGDIGDAAIFAGEEIWIAAEDEVMAITADTPVLKWRLPHTGSELIADLYPIGTHEVLVTTNRMRIYRGHAGEPLLVDWSQGFPPLAAGAGAPIISRVGDAWLAFHGGLYARRETDAAWSPLPPEAAPDGSWRDTLLWLTPTQSSDWEPLPWAPGAWLGTDGTTLFIAGPGRPITPVWRRPVGNVSIKHLRAGATAVYMSQYNATLTATGVAVRPDGAHLLHLA
ncbi:hypothetical protein Q664_17105 [Archangium violaceum Cb vi76]|uniref:Exo-alpha-sialidase n=2 Tax=Archangium violaceum TaxID=83451 RepID=A0A084SUA8_9BACT|nr:hypothetical protein Q664_17105 [Archangium violaceum Cb vi76]